MIKDRIKKAIWAAVTLLCCLLFACVLFVPLGKKAETVSLSASTTEAFTVHRYEVNATVTADRKIVVEEAIDLTFNRVGSQKVFYRSLPKEGDRYFDIWASCDNNADFSYTVADNPDVAGFLDINCKGQVENGLRHTYRFGYTLLMTGEDHANGMIVDFIGAGWPVALRNVTVRVTFPAQLTDFIVYSSGYGQETNQYTKIVSQTQTSLELYAYVLPLTYNDTFEERCAAPITVDFTLVDGGMQPYWTAQFSSPTFWPMIGLAAVCLLVPVLCLLMRKKREIVTVVNLSAPNEMDPLAMGATLDGSVDGEDITSMIYYFADKGYLNISFAVEDDPVLLKKKDLPDTAPAYQKTLFNGLFATGNEVSVSALTNVFYTYVEKAKAQIAPKLSMTERYEKKSVAALVGGVLFGLLSMVLVPFFLAKLFVHGGYAYFSAVSVLANVFFMAGTAVFLFLAEERRYRGSGKTRKKLMLSAVAASVVGILVGSFLMTSVVLPYLERALMHTIAYTGVWFGALCLTRSQEYCETLGQILGFKEFIVVTEEDKIKLMLEEDPQAYYHILPYAQVLGVTDEWESKFKNILLQPPTWCVSADTRMTGFDYYMLNRSMYVMSRAMHSRPQETSGSSVGSSGGGGNFGGFSGGGHGGGGGGLR